MVGSLGGWKHGWKVRKVGAWLEGWEGERLEEWQWQKFLVGWSLLPQHLPDL
jgi:hypothetical protein